MYRAKGRDVFLNLSDKLINMTIMPIPKMNGPILTKFQTLINIMSSAVEAEIGTLHNNGNAAISIRLTLDKMGHKQGPTPLKTDNSTAEVFLITPYARKDQKISTWISIG